MIGRFFHTPTTKKFHITPRYWNPDKDEREERERRIKEELGIVNETRDAGMPFKPNIRGQFRQSQEGFSRSSGKARKASNTRLIILIMILSLIFYLFFYSDFTF